MNILVVEDDPRISDVLEYALKAEGYEVQTAQRGREARSSASGAKSVRLANASRMAIAGHLFIERRFVRGGRLYS